MVWSYDSLGTMGMSAGETSANEGLGFLPVAPATPSDVPSTYCLQEAEELAQSGSTTSPEDVALLKSQVENHVRQMIAEGRSDKEILQAVDMLPYSPDLREVAREVAQNNLDAQKFNMFDNRNQEQCHEFQLQDMLAALGVTGGQHCSLSVLGTLSQQVPDCRDPSREVGRRA